MTRYRVPGTQALVIFVEAADMDDAVAVAMDAPGEQWETLDEIEVGDDIEQAGE